MTTRSRACLWCVVAAIVLAAGRTTAEPPRRNDDRAHGAESEDADTAIRRLPSVEPSQPLLLARIVAIRPIGSDLAVRPGRSTPATPDNLPTSAPHQDIPILASPTQGHDGHPAAPLDDAAMQLPEPPDRENLEAAWAAALSFDDLLEAGRLNLSAEQEELSAAFAERYPVADLRGSYTVRDNEPAFAFEAPGFLAAGTTFPFGQAESFAFQATVSLPLYTGGRIGHSIEAASAQMSAAAHNVDSAALDLKLRVAETYVAVLSAEQDVDVAQVQLRSLEAHTHDVEMLHDRNRVPQNDLLAAQVALANARHEAIRADNQLDLARAAYNRLLHRELTAEVGLAPLTASDSLIDIDDATAAALAQRPELLQASARARALEYLARSMRAADLPQAELLGAYTFEENRFQSPDGIASAGVVVSWNLADGGRTRHQAEAIRHRAEAAWRGRADLESRIRLEVRQAWFDVSETRRRLDVTREAMRRADENLRVTRTRYGLGAATNTEVLDAETLRTTAYRNHHHAAYDAVIAMMRLRRATGEL